MLINLKGRLMHLRSMRLLKNDRSDTSRQLALRLLPEIAHNPRIDRALPGRGIRRSSRAIRSRIANEKNPRNARPLAAPYKSIFFYSVPAFPERRDGGARGGTGAKRRFGPAVI